MNKCKICEESTKNKHYCSMKCRDVSRKEESITYRICLTCKKEFSCRKKAKKKYCSVKCSSSDPFLISKKMEKMKRTNLEKYGVDHYGKTEECREKMKKTNLKKYGVDHYSKTKEYLEKTKKTHLERYGVEFAQQSDVIKSKSKQTVNKKYGGFTFESDALKDKVKKTNLKKYGVENPMKSDQIKKKAQNTNIKKYGDITPLTNEKIKNKTKNTLQEKYGVENISQCKHIKKNINERVIEEFYDSLLNGRIGDDIIPNFSKNEYTGVGYYKQYEFTCKKCNNIFNSVLYGGNTPTCNICNPYIPSKTEIEIYEYIKQFYIGEIIRSSKQIINPYELDFYFSNEKIAIEFNGIYWHSELSGNKDKHYHLNKTKLCEEKNIQLIHISENEWIYKKDIVKNKIRHLLGYSYKEKIYARKCNIREIDSKTKNEFLNKTHIQGEDKSKIKLGAFYNDELIAVMTFGSLRISLGQKNKKLNEYELIRFSSSVHCVGIASKLLTHFIKRYNPNKIITYADKRYSVGNLYEKLNFKHIGNSVPNYWYFHRSNKMKLFHRFKFRKDQLPKLLENFDPSLSEWKNMQMNGFDRIWDCGNLKYEWIRK